LKEHKAAKLTNHAVDTVELGGKKVPVGRLILERRGIGKRLRRRHMAGHGPFLVHNAGRDGGGWVGAILCCGNATNQRVSALVNTTLG